MKPALLPLAYVLGFFAAIPIGATQVEIAKRAMADRLDTAAMVVIGSVASDVMYGSIALFGLAPFMSHKRVVAVFALVGAGVLLALAYFTFRYAAQDRDLKDGSPAIRSRPVSLATGFSLAVTNPPVMFWWLVGVKVAQDLGFADTFSPRVSALFLLFGGLGLGSYLTLLSFIIHRIKHMISARAQHRMHVVLGVILLALAVFLLATGLRDLRT